MTEGKDLEFSLENIQQMQEWLKKHPHRGIFANLHDLWHRMIAEESDIQVNEKHAVENQQMPNISSASLNMNRRNLIQWLGGVIAVLSSSACTRQPPELIIPYARTPEEMIPGIPLFYASAMPLNGYGFGVMVETHMGRPTKIEGNRRHPASFGATDIFAQAAVLSLYDPDRSQALYRGKQINNWQHFLLELQNTLKSCTAKGEGSFRILTPTITSPSLGQLLQNANNLPYISWHQFDPINLQNTREGSLLAFGEFLNVVYDLTESQVILSLDADLFVSYPGKLAYARQFARNRRVDDKKSEMSRIYSLYSSPSLTSARSDHQLKMKPSEIGLCALRLGQIIGISVPQSEIQLKQEHEIWIQAVAKDLLQNQGKSLIAVDESQTPWVHAIVHNINQALNNFGKTVFVTDPIEINPTNQSESLRSLIRDIEDGQVEGLVILSTNPVYTTSGNLAFAESLKKVPFTAHLSLYRNETSQNCLWHIPETHFLESWGDIRSYEGTVTLMQPMIEPLYGSKSSLELIAAILGQPDAKSHDLLRSYWQEKVSTDNFENLFRRWLHDGLIAGSQFQTKNLQSVINDSLIDILNDLVTAPLEQEGLELVIRPDPTVWGGEFTNNAWLQELPKPLTSLTWDNAALISPVTALKQGLSDQDVVELSLREQRVDAPILILPGLADDTILVTLGYGRRGEERLAIGLGYNAYILKTDTNVWWARFLKIKKTGRRYPLARTKDSILTPPYDERGIIRTGSLEDFRQDPTSITRHHEESPFLKPTIPVDPRKFPPELPAEYQWGMSINLNTCIGCNACVIACQSENNVPVVGKEGIQRGRRMHWLRVDTYFSRSIESPEATFAPIPCMHCETAPCELVCPVNATVHNHQGLNQMVYNRCVGTRYCSNNCPYKVRRFNFFNYMDLRPLLKMPQNPDVTVRSRGVMEKCTYCIQRIQDARILAQREGREIKDGELMTACQQVCPTETIIFGNIMNPKWQVSKNKANPLNYEMLGELNTKPRTSYIAKLTNENPALAERQQQEAEDHE